MRLVERIVHESGCDFLVEAPTPALAAAILLAAHKQAFKQCANLVTLPDGLAETQSVCRWSRRIGETFVVKNSGVCRLLDEAGEEIKDVEPDWQGAAADGQPQSAQHTCGPGQGSTAEPSP